MLPSRCLLFFRFLLAALGLHCLPWAFSGCGAWAPHRGAFSWCGGQALGLEGISSCGCGLSGRDARASSLFGIWNLPRPGIKPVPPALADRLLTSWATRQVPQQVLLILVYQRAAEWCSLCCIGFTLCLFIWPCSMWDLSSLTRDQTCDSCIGSVESSPLDCQGNSTGSLCVS